MTVAEVLAAAAPILAGIGVGIRWLLTWYLGRLEAHDNAMVSRFEKMQTSFVDESRALRNQCNAERLADEEKLERHRTEHLADVKAASTVVTEAMRILQKLPPSQRPPS